MSWKIGNVKVTRVIEVDLPTPARLRAARRAAREHRQDPVARAALRRAGRDAADDHPGADRRVAGPQDPGRHVPGQRQERTTSRTGATRRGPFLQDLAAAGHPRESIDTVVCTHLHVDHIGWNTMKVGDRWVPTFPNARYLIGRKEWDYWGTEPVEPGRAADGRVGAADPRRRARRPGRGGPQADERGLARADPRPYTGTRQRAHLVGRRGRRHHRRHDAPPLRRSRGRSGTRASTGTPSRGARRGARRSRAGRRAAIS